MSPPSERDAERLRLELYEWHQRALDAEARNATWDEVARTRSWQLYLRLAAAVRRVAPSGTRRDRFARRLAGARRKPGSAPPASAAPEPKTALFFSDLSGDTLLYRCHHVGESLAEGGWTYDVRHTGSVDFGSFAWLALNLVSSFGLQ